MKYFDLSVMSFGGFNKKQQNKTFTIGRFLNFICFFLHYSYIYFYFSYISCLVTFGGVHEV